MDSINKAREETVAAILKRYEKDEMFNRWLKKAEETVEKAIAKGKANTGVVLPGPLGHPSCLDMGRMLALLGYKTKVDEVIKDDKPTGDYTLHIRWGWGYS